MIGVVYEDGDRDGFLGGTVPSDGVGADGYYWNGRWGWQSLHGVLSGCRGESSIPSGQGLICAWDCPRQSPFKGGGINLMPFPLSVVWELLGKSMPYS